MGIVKASKVIEPEQIEKGGMVQVRLELTASPELCSQPSDIVLVLDRSSSMVAEHLLPMRRGAEMFISKIAEATGGARDRAVGGGTRIGLVSYGSSAVIDCPLTTDVQALSSKIENYTAVGSACHGEALLRASELFEPDSANRKVLVFFTGSTISTGADPDPVARSLRSQGILVCCIGLKVHREKLNAWATDPNDLHTAVTADPAELEALFGKMASILTGTKVTGASIREEISPEFRIVHVNVPTVGSIRREGNNLIQWEIGSLGLCDTETASLTFQILHTGQSTGLVSVNKSILYRDCCGNQAAFPDPKVLITGSGHEPIVPEPCPIPVEFTLGSCQDSSEVNLQDIQLSSLGRVVQLDATLKNICPDKRVALAILLSEVGPDGQEYSRGMKALTIPAHTAEDCRDVQVKCIRFVVPEDLNPSPCDTGSLCRERTFKARVMANYIDTDFRCCDGTVEWSD